MDPNRVHGINNQNIYPFFYNGHIRCVMCSNKTHLFRRFYYYMRIDMLVYLKSEH